MGFFIFEQSEEDKLKLQIKTIVENWDNKLYCTVTGSGVTIVYDKFEIRLETDSNYNKIYNNCFVRFDGKVLYDNENGNDFLLELCKIVYKKEERIKKTNIERAKIEEKNRKEQEKLSRQLLISEALAFVTGLSLSKVSKEVKDEFSPIFTKVKRVMEITKELESIRKEFSIT